MKIKCMVVLLAAGFLLTEASMATASEVPHKVIDVSFDGYCDGMHMNYASAGLGTASTIDGDQTGCVSGGVFGQTSNANDAVYLTVPGFGTFTVINLDHTWVHYGFNGNLIYLVNSGTWSYGAPADRGVASSSPRAEAPKALSPAATIDIALDGYCDGMHLVSPSAGLGTPGTVDGNRTGCASEGLIGGKTKVHNQGTFAVTFLAGGTTWIQTAIFVDHTWIHYGVQGNLIYINNTGTWSFGTPMGSGRSSTS